MKEVNEFVRRYRLFENDEIQKIQLNHRYELCKAFGIKEGMRVLEIGCGQGDTTAILAHLVGDTGHVVALDIASADYGAPQTLQQAHEVLKASELGNRITFYLETDFLSFNTDETYDVIVLAHSSWYFNYEHVLVEYFKKMKSCSKKLCLAEWDLQVNEISQKAHYHAVNILALYSAFIKNDGNVQRLWSQGQLLQLAERAGWSVDGAKLVAADYLQDGSWEVAAANQIRADFGNVPAAIQVIVKGHYELMNAQAEVKSLNSIVLNFN